MANDNYFQNLKQVGFSGEEYPLEIFPSIIGIPKYKDILFGFIQKDTYIGDEAQIKRGVLSIRYPIENVPSEHPIFHIESPFNSKSNREKLGQTMFESFGIPSLYIGISSILSLCTTDLKYSSWIGSILASLSTFQEMYISKDE
ncbi:hypothetical protein ACTFIR_009035 [Dictyostelium discoideum]